MGTLGDPGTKFLRALRCSPAGYRKLGYIVGARGISIATRSVQRVNYDLIAHLYGEPSRDHELDSHPVQLLSERGDRSGARLQILETGYSTGKQLAAGRMELFIETKKYSYASALKSI